VRPSFQSTTKLEPFSHGVCFQYGKRLVSISTSEEGVTAIFEDGSVETGSLLIGAEGAHSITRTWLFQQPPQDAALMEVPISSFVTLAKLNREVALALKAIEGASCIALSPGLFTFFAGYDCTSQDPAEWVFMIIITWPVDDDAETQAALAKDSRLLLERTRERTKGLVYPFDAMVRSIPEDTRVWYGKRMTYWPTKPWDNRGGRVTLAGDAVHAMTFRTSRFIPFDRLFVMNGKSCGNANNVCVEPRQIVGRVWETRLPTSLSFRCISAR
jgi:2-polyprenyl-6-methoxyphenol hydroxylase-like FAD-dependent oxidoreductase